MNRPPALRVDGWTRFVGDCLALVSPIRALAWRKMRGAYRSFAAAKKTGPNGYWRPRNRSGDADLQRDFPMILARCRDLAQNNPFISGAIVKICNNAVRTGIRPQYNLKKSDGKTPDSDLNRRLEAHWRRWARRETADITGHDSVAGIQRLGLRHTWVDGEFLVHRVFDTSVRNELPLRLELIECDHLDASVDGDMKNGHIARRGVELDAASGRPVAYHLLDSHPGDYRFHTPSSRRIPAADIIHVYDRSRISMTRGVSWFVAIAMEMYDFADYQSYERIGAKLAAAFGVFVKSQYPETFGAGNPLGGNPQAVGGDGLVDKGELPDYIEPGRIQSLPYGTDIEIASHKRPGDTYEPYVRTSLRGSSAGVPLSYETFANDNSKSSYSSARNSTLEDRLTYRGMQFFLNEQLNGGLNRWFLEAVNWKFPHLLPGFDRDPYRYQSAVNWQEPGWSWVDPLKDAGAAEKELNLYLNTRRNQSAQRGLDWDEIMDQTERELDRIMDLEKKRAAITQMQQGATANAQE